MKVAGLSVDVDSVASHLAGYGFPKETGSEFVYTVAVPRALEVFEALNARATFFLIASEARKHPAAVRSLVAAGHEVGSHSLTHTLPFPRSASPELSSEVRDSKEILESICGQEVVGFRAPSWEYSPALLDALAAHGYWYDASVFASPLLLALRWSVARRGEGVRTPLRLTWKECVHPAAIRRVSTRHGEVAEVPVCTTPGLRIPYYHTLGFLLPAFAQGLVGRLARSRSRGVSYCFHAVDFLGLSEDGLDPRMDRHPGMRLPLGEKLRTARAAIRKLSEGRAVVPLAELVAGEGLGEVPGARWPRVPAGSPNSQR